MQALAKYIGKSFRQDIRIKSRELGTKTIRDPWTRKKRTIKSYSKTPSNTWKPFRELTSRNLMWSKTDILQPYQYYNSDPGPKESMVVNTLFNEIGREIDRRRNNHDKYLRSQFSIFKKGFHKYK